LNVFEALLKSQIKGPKEYGPQPETAWQVQNRVSFSIFVLALAASISTWFIALRAPLRLDETGSYWQINAGFIEIWPRQFSALSFPAYSYILWFSTKLIGTSEIALRIPSVIAMLGAVYLLYLAAREMFERDIAIIAAVVFCLHPIVVFAAIDIRPYAFGALATNAAILILLRLRHNDSSWLAALFGLAAASIIWFHYIFGLILPALALCFIFFKFRDRKTLLRQLGIALGVFALALLPAIPGLTDLFSTSRTHVYEVAPDLSELAWTVAPGFLPFVLFGSVFLAFLVVAATRQRFLFNKFEGWRLFVCASLALIPVLILYGLSVGSSMHMFAPRHRLEAIPGIALCWAFVLSRFRSRYLAVFFCVALVGVTAFRSLNAPLARDHDFSMTYALEAAEKSASADRAPIVLCSGFVESNYSAMPSPETVKDSLLFAPITYYKLSGPVVPLPQLLNKQALQISSQFLQQAAQTHQHFLLVADPWFSHETLDWFAQNAAASHTVHKLGMFQGTEVLEFVPRTDPAH
jgi:hypothetical protein